MLLLSEMAVGAITSAALVPRMPAGGVRVLVGPPVFKTGVSSDPAQAGSIPVRLRGSVGCQSSWPAGRRRISLMARCLGRFTAKAITSAMSSAVTVTWL